MQDGPTIIKCCPACNGLIAQETFLSGNTFGADFWTDGEMYAPMLPPPYWLVKCPHCFVILWFDEVKKVGEVKERRPPPRRFEGARGPRPLRLADYLEELAKGGHSERKERFIRFELWHRWNDCRRNDQQPKKPMSKQERDNLRALLALIAGQPDEEMLMARAEMLRELRLFKEAAAVFDHQFSDGFAANASFIRELIARREHFVAKVPDEVLGEEASSI